MAADSRTNAGVDYISTYQKLIDFSQPGDRIILLCTSGNLSITQAVVSTLQRELKQEEIPNLHTLPTLYEIARHIGAKTRQAREQDQEWLQRDGIDFQCSFLLGGQVIEEQPELYLIYSQGNCIQATRETPFLQVGETKYGKPILDRIVTYETPLESVAKAALLSIDSTMKSNASVGPPIDLVMYQSGTYQIQHQMRLRLGDPYLISIRKLWEKSLREAFDRIPDIDWSQDPDQASALSDADSLHM